MVDTLIINGMVIDGSGRDAYKADIAIINGKISAIGDLSTLESKEVIDAQGACVAPGFIDVHTHSDMTLFYEPRQVSQIRQGVTTQIGGLCGTGLAPITEKGKALMAKSFGVADPKWSDFASYIDYANSMNLGTNIGFFVGHGTLRLNAMDNPIAPNPSVEEMKAMADMLEDSIKAGAFGMTTGLEYNPGKASEMHELEVLCNVLAKYDALHASHTRNRDKFYIHAINEVIDVTRATGARLQISHINPKYGCHDSTIQDLYDMINHAREAGFYVTADVMPSQWNHTGAMAILPLWAQNIPADELRQLLSTKEGRAKLKDNPTPVWQLVAQEKWDRVYQFGGVKTKDTIGLSLAEIAQIKNCSGWDAFCSLLLAEDGTDFTSVMLTSDAFSIDDIAIALEDPYTSVVSDGMGLATDGPLAERIFAPNTYDWISAYFHNFVFNDNPLLSLEEAIAKLTAIPAMQLGIMDRGMIDLGQCADITIFRPENIKSNVTLKNPRAYVEGIEQVLVNGKTAYKIGDDTIHCHGIAIKFQTN